MGASHVDRHRLFHLYIRGAGATVALAFALGACGDTRTDPDPTDASTDASIDASHEPAPCTSAAECDDGLVCNGLETCVAGSCVTGTPVHCKGAGSDAVHCMSVCAELGSGKTVCVRKAQDEDSDGHGDAACLGAANATDCDDTNPTVHRDAVELCDGLDNDCNGMPELANGVVLLGHEELLEKQAKGHWWVHAVWSPVAQVYGVVWSDEYFPGGAVHFVRMKASGERVGESFQVSDTHGRPRIAASANEFGVLVGGSSSAVFRRVNALDGALLDSEIALPELASDLVDDGAGGWIAVGGPSGGPIRALKLAPDGAPVGAPVDVPNSVGYGRGLVARHGERLLASFASAATIRTELLSSLTLSVLPGSFTAATQSYETFPTATAAPDGFFVAWGSATVRKTSPSGAEVCAHEVDASADYSDPFVWTSTYDGSELVIGLSVDPFLPKSWSLRPRLLFVGDDCKPLAPLLEFPESPYGGAWPYALALASGGGTTTLFTGRFEGLTRRMLSLGQCVPTGGSGGSAGADGSAPCAPLGPGGCYTCGQMPGQAQSAGCTALPPQLCGFVNPTQGPSTASGAKFFAMIACVCSPGNCDTVCAKTCTQNEVPTAECFACFPQKCPNEVAACDDDDGTEPALDGG